MAGVWADTVRRVDRADRETSSKIENGDSESREKRRHQERKQKRTKDIKQGIKDKGYNCS